LSSASWVKRKKKRKQKKRKKRKKNHKISRLNELGPELRDAVGLFYLILRALDTIEDDMSFDTVEKIEELRHFHEKLYTPGWTFTRCGEGFEKTLLVEFDRVIDCFLELKPEYQSVIQEITERMGVGMAEFLNKKVDSMADWDRYCHYVAGLVGIGLSKLFTASGLEDEWFAKSEEMANSMGLFLQKTNIIRDFLEDLNDNRCNFWPAATWTKYASKLDEFKDPQNAKNAVHCLNDLITNALHHLPDCLEYMSRLKDQQNFSFCAIPQIMAIGTLAACYNNHDVFTGIPFVLFIACYLFLLNFYLLSPRCGQNASWRIGQDLVECRRRKYVGGV
jgi:farnesyl-diphosphate farnesyltransferase